MKEYFYFDSFMNKINSAILSSRRVAHLAEKSGDKELIQKARQSLVDIGGVREMIDKPLVWFKMEKGAIYKKISHGNWTPVDSKKPKALILGQQQKRLFLAVIENKVCRISGQGIENVFEFLRHKFPSPGIYQLQIIITGPDKILWTGLWDSHIGEFIERS